MATDGATEKITFIESFVPPLEAGEYQVSVQQTLLNTGKGEQINEAYTNTANIAVSGERFSLSPDGVETVFPPVNNQGEYSNVLPHILLLRRTLLWERSPTASVQGIPWLALLLFDADDPPPPVQTIKVGDLQRGNFEGQPSTLPAEAVSYVDGFANLGLAFAPEYGESYTDSCQAIDVPVSLFSAIAPSLHDLGWLGSARTVSTEKKAGTPSEAPGTFSLLIGNRKPTPNRKCTVHLVSLEGMASFLPTGSDYKPASLTLPNGNQASLIRLVSLKNWNFTSVDAAESFEAYLTNLDAGPLQRVGMFNIEPPGPPSDTDANRVVATAFGLGYTAVNHQTRQGDNTVSWYRGPFVPFEVPATIFIPPPDRQTNLPAQIINTADQLVRYDPNNGMMDVTYAAAWELGRQMGLASKSFAIALYNWRRTGQQATVTSVTHAAITEKLGGLLCLPPPGSRDTSAIQRAAAEFILNHLAAILAPEEEP